MFKRRRAMSTLIPMIAPVAPVMAMTILRRRRGLQLFVGICDVNSGLLDIEPTTEGSDAWCIECAVTFPATEPRRELRMAGIL